MDFEKALRGLMTANLRSLEFVPEPARFRDYLRGLEGVHASHTYSPLRSVSLPDLLGKEFCEALFLPVGCIRPGSTPLGDLAALAALARAKRPKRIFEIGTFEGLSTVVFLKNSDGDAFVHTLDLPRETEASRRTERSYEAHSIGDPYVSGCLIDRFGVRQRTQALLGDSALFDFRPFRRQIDLFFVDGAHTADYVSCDSRWAFECLAEEGWLLWHDCFTPQVMKGLKRIARRTKVWQIQGTTLALAMGADHQAVR